MGKESIWPAVKAGLPVGAVFFGAVVGPAMVTGSYTVNYFLNYGVSSWVICIFYAAVISLFFYCGFEHTRLTAECNPGVDVYNYATLAKSLYGKYQFMVPLYDLWVFFAMVITGAATVATGGTLVASFLGVSYALGIVIMTALILVIGVLGAEVVRKASTGMMFAMVGMMLLLLVITLARKGDMIAQNFAINWQPDNVLPLGRGFWRVFVLCCSSSSWALGLGGLAQKMTTKKSTLAGSCSAGIMGGLAYFLMFLIVLPWAQQIFGETVNGTPVLSIVTEWMGIGWLSPIYYALMILALISSGAPALFIASNRIRELIPVARNSEKKTMWIIVCGVIYGVVITITASQGLTTVVSKYFQYLGYYGQIFGVIPMVIIWPILRVRGVKPVLPASKKSEESNG